MNSELHYREGTSIYPGEFKLPEGMEDQLSKEVKNCPQAPSMPPNNLTEEEQYYRIEIPVPGFERKDFCIGLDDHLLNISCLNKLNAKADIPQSNVWSDPKFTKTQIALPVNADIDLVMAEYRNGRLYIFIYKENCISTHHRPARVSVY
jgi:HSP20 family molecular chaperone IbpA